MTKLTKSKLNSETDFRNDAEYTNCVIDLINNPVVRSMESFIQHSDLTCFEHSINVSYNSFLVCRYFGLNYEAAARGGLLHDLFLYDWHIPRQEKGLHGFTHASTALNNANKYFSLNDMEKDIIIKHMWPLNLKLPRYKEALIVCFVDKYCAFMEFMRPNYRGNIYRIKDYANQLNNV